jgi:hypothetical protein
MPASTGWLVYESFGKGRKPEFFRIRQGGRLNEPDRRLRGAITGRCGWAHVAVLDESGEIVSTNEAWRTFATNNGIDWREVSEGVNYFAVCVAAERAGVKEAAAVNKGMSLVLRGRLREFAMEYPCHSPTQRRYFVVRVWRFSTAEGYWRLVVTHEDITERKLAEAPVL